MKSQIRQKVNEIKKIRLFLSMLFGLSGGVLALLIMFSEWGNLPIWTYFIPIPFGAWLGWCLR